jgi:hypothetical protein
VRVVATGQDFVEPIVPRFSQARAQHFSRNGAGILIHRLRVNNDADPELKRLGFLHITVLVLSVYVLAALLAQSLLALPPQVNLLLDRIDVFVCFVFLAEFCISFHRAASKLAFMRNGGGST